MSNKNKFWKIEGDNITLDNPLENFDISKQSLLSNREMQFNNDKLYARLSKYKNSSCYHFLQSFYDFYLLSVNSKNEKSLDTNYNNAVTCLKLFSYCWEDEYRMNENY